MSTAAPVEITVLPATAERWSDLERLFGPRGAYGGCWCLYWRLTARDFKARSGDDNRADLKSRVLGDEPPGLLAYADGEPVGWISLAPRADLPRFSGSRVLAPVDEVPVWSIACFFIARAYRGRGLSGMLLEAACRFAQEQGCRVLEGYPIAPAKHPYPTAYAWTGFATTFERLGFVEVARRSPTRPIMRLELAA